MNFKYDSFKSDGVNKYRDQVGSLSGSFNEKEISCRAYKASNGDLVIAGFLGKYRATQRAWIATVWLNKNSELSFSFGFESGVKKSASSSLIYDPDEYFKQAPQDLFSPLLSDPGFDFGKDICRRCNNELKDYECLNCEHEFAKKYGY